MLNAGGLVVADVIDVIGAIEHFLAGWLVDFLSCFLSCYDALTGAAAIGVVAGVAVATVAIVDVVAAAGDGPVV